MDVEALMRLPVGDLFGLAESLKRGGQGPAAAGLYRNWIACRPDDPALYAAWFNYAVALSEAGDAAGSVLAFREAVRLKPDFEQARLSLGLALEKAGQGGAAILQWLATAKTLGAVTGETVAQKVMALENTGRVLEGLEQDQAAEDALKERLDLVLDDKVIQHWIALRMRQCKWPVLEASARLKRSDLLAGISPLSLACLLDDPLFQLANAFRYFRTLVGPPQVAAAAMPEAPARPRAENRLRLGYVSSDLREHAVGFSIIEALESHDRTRFEVFAYYCGIEREDTTKARYKAAVDHWTSLNGLGDEAAAAKIRADGIDILVDLNGYTKDARTRVFALRPAPVVVNWFGFPATMGSPCHHYIVADEVVIPQRYEHYYSETVVRLPCYQANDRQRVVAEPPLRASEGLPDDAVVFCCLNGLQKLTAERFGSWVAILAGVPAGVMWLLGGTPDTRQRLRDRAAEAGIAPGRLVFADKKPNPEHVARYALADLFLDNGPYGAHTTASDALWMGLPILTVPGRGFASRVCASLVTAAGLPELVCASLGDYTARAIALGNDRPALAVLRTRLKAGRDTCLLFDTPRLVAHLEAAYLAMAEAHRAGRTPRPDLANLDVYGEIAIAVDIDAIQGLDDDAYEASYRTAIEAWNAILPIDRDRRLFREASRERVRRAG